MCWILTTTTTTTKKKTFHRSQRAAAAVLPSVCLSSVLSWCSVFIDKSARNPVVHTGVRLDWDCYIISRRVSIYTPHAANQPNQSCRALRAAAVSVNVHLTSFSCALGVFECATTRHAAPSYGRSLITSSIRSVNVRTISQGKCSRRHAK